MSDDTEFGTLDDVFQFLIRIRNVSPVMAKAQMLEKLQLDMLWVDNRVEVEDPPIKINRRVHYNSWGTIFGLRIQDGRLIVILTGSVDPPYWAGYSFTVANPHSVRELWPSATHSAPEAPVIIRVEAPLPSPQPTQPAQPAEQPSSQAMKRGKRGSANHQILDKAFPKLFLDGVVPDSTTGLDILRKLDAEPAIWKEACQLAGKKVTRKPDDHRVYARWLTKRRGH